MEKSNPIPANWNPGQDRPRAMAAIPIALSDIKIAHSVFALPFAVLGAFLVAPRSPAGDGILWPRFLGQLALVVVCMVCARTWAMLVNRLADRRFDADNPRTARRTFASGRLDARSGWVIALGCAVLFQLGAAGFWVLFGNPWPTWLAIPVLAWIALYSFTKRFTWLCHIFLGGALAASPIAAAIAVRGISTFVIEGGALPAEGRAILLLAGFVLCWVAGFDVAYALQDIDFDRRTGLHSIPARLGVRGSLWVSRGLHVLACACLIAAWLATPQLGRAFAPAVLLVGALLVWEHAVLARRGVAGLPLAFFTINGMVSLALGVAGSVDAWMSG